MDQKVIDYGLYSQLFMKWVIHKDIIDDIEEKQLDNMTINNSMILFDPNRGNYQYTFKNLDKNTQYFAEIHFYEK